MATWQFEAKIEEGRGGASSAVDPAIASISEQWARVNANIAEIVRQMTPDDLSLPTPRGWPMWALVAHTVGPRAYWLCGVMKQPGAEKTPFSQTTITTGDGWEDHLDTPRSKQELLDVIDSTWQVIAGWLQRWNPEMLRETYPRQAEGGTEWHTHPSIFTRLITHDGYHAGEISMILGTHGREAIDIWHDVTGKAPSTTASPETATQA